MDKKRSSQEDSLCNCDQLSEAQVFARDDNGHVSCDNIGLVVDGSLEDTLMCGQPIEMAGLLGFGSGCSRLGGVLSVRRLRVGSRRQFDVALDAIVGVLRNAGHLTGAESHCGDSKRSE
jgi:hypothetical protein